MRDQNSKEGRNWKFSVSAKLKNGNLIFISIKKLLLKNLWGCWCLHLMNCFEKLPLLRSLSLLDRQQIFHKISIGLLEQCVQYLLELLLSNYEVICSFISLDCSSLMTIRLILVIRWLSTLKQYHLPLQKLFNFQQHQHLWKILKPLEKLQQNLSFVWLWFKVKYLIEICIHLYFHLLQYLDKINASS